MLQLVLAYVRRTHELGLESFRALYHGTEEGDLVRRGNGSIARGVLHGALRKTSAATGARVKLDELTLGQARCEIEVLRYLRVV